MSHGLVTDQFVSRDELIAMRSRTVHVIGAASAEGVAVMRLLVSLGFTSVVPHDMRERALLRKAFRTTHGAYTRQEQDAIWEQLAPLLDRGHFGDAYLTGISAGDVMSLGQGWYLEPGNRAQIVDAAREVSIILSMSSLYMALINGPVAGITGTNGKSTTTAFVEHCFDVAGTAVSVAGNERSSRQFLHELDSAAHDHWALLEVSNRQLLQLTVSPQVAAITALTPDHLEEHDGFAGYVAAKRRLFAHQHARDIAIACADDAEACAAASSGPAERVLACGTGEHVGPGVRWVDGMLTAIDVPVHDTAGGGIWSGNIAHRTDVQVRGEHNLRNLAVGAAVALACGIDPAHVGTAIATYVGKSLRMEHLATLDGVDIWSDVKATTPEATVAALDALFDSAADTQPRHVHLILGGEDKGLDYSLLARAIDRYNVTAWAVPGSATNAIIAARAHSDTATQLHEVDHLEAALDAALARAAAGEAVIVSPAAAGFWTTQLQGGASLRTMIRRRSRDTGNTMEAQSR